MVDWLARKLKRLLDWSSRSFQNHASDVNCFCTKYMYVVGGCLCALQILDDASSSDYLFWFLISNAPFSHDKEQIIIGLGVEVPCPQHCTSRCYIGLWDQRALILDTSEISVAARGMDHREFRQLLCVRGSGRGSLPASGLSNFRYLGQCEVK